MRKRNLFALLATVPLAIGAAVVPTMTAQASQSEAQRQLNDAHALYGDSYNYVTYRVDKGSNWSVTGLHACRTINSFKTIVFKSGTFVRGGDGGWNNWAIFGTFTRTNDRRVEFSVHDSTLTDRSIQGC